MDVPLREAELRVAEALAADNLSRMSAAAFGEGVRLLVRAGLPGITKQVEVQSLPPYERDDEVVVIAFTWHATGMFGDLFPVLDANLELSEADATHTLLTLAGSYRPPAGRIGKALDRVLLHQVAETTAVKFLDCVADAVEHTRSGTHHAA
jgi:hypothetical protein